MFQISHKQHVFPVIYSRSFRQPGDTVIARFLIAMQAFSLSTKYRHTMLQILNPRNP